MQWIRPTRYNIVSSQRPSCQHGGRLRLVNQLTMPASNGKFDAVGGESTRHASSRLRIVILGYIVRGPIGGMAWHHLNYVLGLKQLGHEVLFLEDSDDYPSCYDPTTHTVGTDPRYGLRFAKQAFDKLNLADCWAYYDAHQSVWQGPAAGKAIRFCGEADLLLNVSGVNPIRSWLEKIPWRVFVDTDPVFTQVRHLKDPSARRRALAHNAFFSFGELIESSENTIPEDGFAWRPTRQPVVLDAWPISIGPADGPFSTVMQWNSYPPVEWDGKSYGMKSQSFEIVRNLPGSVSQHLEIALGGTTAPRRELERVGGDLEHLELVPGEVDRVLHDDREVRVRALTLERVDELGAVLRHRRQIARLEVIAEPAHLRTGADRRGVGRRWFVGRVGRLARSARDEEEQDQVLHRWSNLAALSWRILRRSAGSMITESWSAPLEW